MDNKVLKSKEEERNKVVEKIKELKEYSKPEVLVHSLEEAILVAASRSGMGMCKQTYI